MFSVIQFNGKSAQMYRKPGIIAFTVVVCLSLKGRRNKKETEKEMLAQRRMI